MAVFVKEVVQSRGGLVAAQSRAMAQRRYILDRRDCRDQVPLRFRSIILTLQFTNGKGTSI